MEKEFGCGWDLWFVGWLVVGLGFFWKGRGKGFSSVSFYPSISGQLT